MVDDSESAAIEQRIERLILVVGALMTIVAAIVWRMRAAEGTAIGTALCWLNFRWLRQGAAGVIRLGLAQAGAENINVPRRVHAKFFGRIVLLLLVVYAILAWLRLPALAVVSGLAAVVPAIMLELGYEMIHDHHRWNAQ
jgi:hypothetical protein